MKTQFNLKRAIAIYGNLCGLILVCIFVLGLVVYGFWNLQRWFNWEMLYKDKAITLIEEKVKPECLK